MSMIHPWHAAELPLRFQLSDITIAKPRLRILACEMAVDAGGSAAALPPDQPLSGDMAGYLIRGLPLSGPRPRLETRDGFVLYTPHQYRRYFVDLRLSFEDYAKTLTAKSRSTIRRKVKKFAQHCGGSIDFRVYRTADEMQAFCDSGRIVSATTYQERLLDAGLPQSRDFLESLRHLAIEDRVRGYIIFHDQRPVSYLLLTATDSVLTYDYLGFDPAYGSWSIGTVLHWLVLEQLCQEARFDLLDFTEGEGQQKRQFSTGHRECANVYCLRDTWGYRMLLYLHWINGSASEAAGRLASRIGLRSRIRRWMRGQERT